MTEQEFTTQELAHEEWRDVIGYEGIYSVSNLGRIRRDKASEGAVAGRILKRRPSKKGYVFVILYSPLGKRNHSIHGLVATAFIGPIPDGFQVNHKDGVKTNARSSNLEYKTPSENVLHAIELGLRANQVRGITHPRAKLNPKLVMLIRNEYQPRTVSVRQLARKYNVGPSTIQRVLKHQCWLDTFQPSQDTIPTEN